MTPRHGLGLAILLALQACGEGPVPAASPAPVPAAPALPATAEGFLREILPLPSDALVVVYAIEGPGGLRGSLEVLLRPGGLRRENWRLSIPVDGRPPAERLGTRIVTPEHMWAGAEGSPGVLAPLPLAALGRSYAALDPSRRRAAIEALRAWRVELERARREHPGERRVVAGQACTWMRVAAQTLCMWEEAGLPLRIEGPALSAEAVRVDRAPDLAADAFTLPSEAAQARRVPPPAALAAVGPEFMDRVLAGDVAPLALAVQPGFRPPLDIDGPSPASEGGGGGDGSAGQVHP